MKRFRELTSPRLDWP